MTRGRYALAAAVIAVALAEAFAIALFLLVPEKREYWLIAALTMPILWSAAELLKRDKASLRFAVSYAAMVLAVAEALAVARATGAIANDAFALRFLGIVCGLVIVHYGNIAPKQASCVDPASPDAGRRQGLQRHLGWVLVLAGLANTLIWLLVPIERAALWSMAPVAAALALIAIRVARSRPAQGKAA